MRFLRRLMAIASLLLVAVFLLSFLPSGRYLMDRVERIGRMAYNQVFYQAYWPIPFTPDLEKLNARLKEKGLHLGAPVFVRIFKKEAQLEIWMKKDESFVRFASYPICYYSGRLGPKLKQGDRQAPEGFYTVSAGQLNPNSRWHRAFNLGYPNLFDRSHSRTGNFLMVHGGCSSIGCYAMTNPVIDEIWKLVTSALRNGQGRFHVHAYPFRMTDFNMFRYQGHKWSAFWEDLKQGYDLFEQTHVPPVVYVCDDRYQVRPARIGSNGNAVLSKDCSRQAQLQATHR